MESIKELSKGNILEILSNSQNMKIQDTKNLSLQNIIFGLLFFEPSTRTCLSFESAINRLGGKIIKYNKDYSSEKKGESLEDTIKTIDYYVDVFIIRHSEKNIISKIKNITNKPIINAGDGSGEHPTQALLDLFTIFDYHKEIPKNIAFTGEIKYSRTIHSLVYLLSKFNTSSIFHFVSDDKLKPEGEFLDFLKKINNNYFIHDNINSIINNIDVLYITRIQKERFNDEKVKPIIINKEIVKNSKESMIIMHPLPRNNELSTDLDDYYQSKYFEQIQNGVYVRMAIIDFIINKKQLYFQENNEI